MRRIVVNPLDPDPRVIADAAAVIRGGGLVAFPTETVYGLGANALDAAAVARIYDAKGRPAYNPIIVHVADADGARAVTSEWPDRATALAERFWPGPLTLVLAKREIVPAIVSAGLDAVGVRVPAHPVALALIRAAGVPIAAPSANASMAVSPTTAEHVAKSLGGAVDVVLDAGATTVGIESTVLDLGTVPPTLLRPGTIAMAELEAVVGPVAVAGRAAGDAGGTARRSPGMLDRHYAPRARVRLVDAAAVRRVLLEEREGGRRAGALAMQQLENIHTDFVNDDLIIAMPRDPAGYAARLYAALHALDDRGADVIVIARVPPHAAWLGVRDRLERAAR